MDKLPVTRAGPQWTKKIRGTPIENATGGEGMSSTGYEVFFLCGDWTILWAAGYIGHSNDLDVRG